MNPLSVLIEQAGLVEDLQLEAVAKDPLVGHSQFWNVI